MLINLKNAIDSFKKLVVFLFFIILAPVLFTGCQTATQRKTELFQAEAEALKQRDRVCYQNIKYKHEKDKNVLSYMEPWLDSDTADGKGFFDGGDNIPTEYEVKVIIGIYNDIANCRVQLIESLKRISPNMVPIYVQSYRASDLNITDLIERKISWREARDRKITLDNETERKIIEEALRLEKDLEMSHNADLENQRANAQTGSAAQSLQSQQQAQVDQLRKQQSVNDLHRSGSMVTIGR